MTHILARFHRPSILLEMVSVAVPPLFPLIALLKEVRMRFRPIVAQEIEFCGSTPVHHASLALGQ